MIDKRTAVRHDTPQTFDSIVIVKMKVANANRPDVARKATVKEKYDTAVFERFTLSNGIAVYVQRSPILPDERYQVSACLLHTGSCADPPDAAGTMHFFEHIPFRGTEHYPSTAAIHKPITSEAGMIGGKTSVQVTKFFVTGAKSQLNTALPILADVVAAPRILEKHVIRERGVIAQEHREVMSQRKYVFDYHFRRWFFSGHPYGHGPIGELRVIESMTVEQLRRAHQTYYHAGNLALICTGDLPADAELIAVAEANFGNLPRRAAYQVPAPTLPAQREGETADPVFGVDSLTLLFPLPNLTPRAAMVWICLAVCLNSHLEQLLRRSGLIYESRLAILNRDQQQPTFEVLVPTQRHHFGEIQKALTEVLGKLTATHWENARQIIQRKLPLCFLHPIEAEELALDDLLRGQAPVSIRQKEALRDALTWEELDACRNQLLSTEPYIFRAIAG